MPYALRRILSGYARDERGSITVEFVLIVPLLFWAFMASYVFLTATAKAR
ncbi:TadE/TadG family type IV pilus assembly protein [Jhaorihella thermophila]